MSTRENPAANPKFAKKSLPTGVTLHYLEKGKPEQIPTIFLHGYIDSWRSFRGVLAALPPSCHAIALDLRGHGDSDKLACCYTMPNFTADLLELMDALGLARVNLVGHSLGSFIAQSLAARFPRRVERLILISSAPSAAANALLRELQPHIEALQDPIDRIFVAAFQSPSNPISPDFLEMIISESLKVPARVWRAAFSGLLEVDHRPLLGDITAPTLILWGNQDELFQRGDQDGLLAAIPEASLIEYPAGHALHWEMPQEIAADLEKFLQF
jgi:non-heme chloroperoxidase